MAVVGAGAAGSFAALAASGALGPGGEFEPLSPPPRRVILLDGQPRPGRKILVSGGGRCNVTNARVTAEDFSSQKPRIVRQILAEFPPEAVRAFFSARGVPLAEEPLGKLFPQGGRAPQVLDALFGAVEKAGIRRAFGAQVGGIGREEGVFVVGGHRARRVIVSTGGRSLPLTGSTGMGYAWAQELGHTLVPTVPALTPLLADVPESLAGITVPVILRVEDASGTVLRRAAGSMLFTHRGVSGPAALDVSEAVERCLAAGTGFRVLADLWTLTDPQGPFARYLDGPKLPGACLPGEVHETSPRDVESAVLEATRRRSRRPLGAFLVPSLPRRLVEVLVPDAGVPLATLSREARQAAAQALASFDLKVRGTEGYAKAEVTAGGVPLHELDRRTMESRLAPGVHFCGEVCDATGRLGGFNFQWAWSSGFVAGRGAAR